MVVKRKKSVDQQGGLIGHGAEEPTPPTRGAMHARHRGRPEFQPRHKAKKKRSTPGRMRGY